MSITTILFDLDGTLLPMDQDVFIEDYFRRIAATLAVHGYESKQLVDTIWRGTAAMIKNSSGKSNEEVFWNVAVSVYGDKILQDKPYFDEFYETEFDKIKEVCVFQPAASEIVQKLKADGYRIILATNPIFPSRATEWRIRWAGLTPEDFVMYTTYENSHHSKPDQDYYWEIMHQLGIKPEECLMVGNDVEEDMIAETIGMNVFLLKDCLINKKNKDISIYPNGTFVDLISYIECLNRK